MADFNAEVGNAAGHAMDLGWIKSQTKSSWVSNSVSGYYNLRYYQRVIDGNCNNGNCPTNCNCGGACDNCGPTNTGAPIGSNCNCNCTARNCSGVATNCTACTAVNCWNCDGQKYFQGNCQGSDTPPSYNCNITGGTTGNCNTVNCNCDCTVINCNCNCVTNCSNCSTGY